MIVLLTFFISFLFWPLLYILLIMSITTNMDPMIFAAKSPDKKPNFLFYGFADLYIFGKFSSFLHKKKLYEIKKKEKNDFPVM